MVVCEVTITYRDDTKECIDCCDTPFFGDKFLTLYPLKSSLSRRLIATERIAGIEWDYIVKDQK